MTSSHQACWREAAGRLEAWNKSQGQPGIAYLSSICALCRADDQPWNLLLHALQVPRLLCRAISIMLEDADAMQDPTYEQLMAVIMATANLIRTAYNNNATQQQQGDTCSTWHLTCSVLSSQIVQSGLLQQLPVALNDVTEAVVACAQHVCGDSSSCNKLVLLGLPLLQLCTDICLIWPGGILSSLPAAPATAATLQLALAVLSQSSRSTQQLPSMLYWKAANIIVQLTDPAAVEAAAQAAAEVVGANAPDLTTTGNFLQAVVIVLVIQAHWLLQPAAASICSNRRRCHSSDDVAANLRTDSLSSYSCGSFSCSSATDVGSGSAQPLTASDGSSGSSTSAVASAMLSTSSSSPIPSSSSGGTGGSSGSACASSISSSIVRTSSAGSCANGSQHVGRQPSWLFRNVASYWAQSSDTATATDQQQQQHGPGELYPSHARLLDSLGLQQHKLYELIEVVYNEGDRCIGESDIALQLQLLARLSRCMRVANQKERSCQVASQHVDTQHIQHMQQLMPVMALSIAAHSPSNFGLVTASATVVQEALRWWPLLVQPPRAQEALAPGDEGGAGRGTPLQQPHAALPVRELLQLLVHTIQKVLHQPDKPIGSWSNRALTNAPSGAAGAGSHSSGVCALQQPTKAAALDALADAVGALSNACVECDADGSLTAWQQDSQPLAAAFTAVLRDAAAAAQSRSRKADGSIDKLLVTLLYAERFFFMDTAKCVPAVYGAAAGRADGEAGQLVALLLSTL